MDYLYYTSNSAIALLVLMLLNFKFLRRKYADRVKRDYVKFLNTIIVFFVVDTVWGGLMIHGNQLLVHTGTVAHFVAMAFTVGFCCRFVASFLSLGKAWGNVLKYLGYTSSVAMMIGLAINEYKPVFFSYDKTEGFHTLLYCDAIMMAVVVMSVVVSLASYITMMQSSGDLRRRYRYIFMLTLSTICCVLLQMSNSILPFYSLALLIDVLVMHVYIFEDELEVANKAKLMFLNNMSHDIRTPMNAIVGFANLMEKHKDNPELVDDYLKKIKSSSKYLMDILNNVLDMARIDSGKTVVDEEFYDFDDKDKRVVYLFFDQMKEKNITFTGSVDVKHRYVKLDHTKVNQIVVNLVSNAVKYTPAGGNISVTIKEIPSEREGFMQVEFKVQDTGIGMSKDYLDHIFDSFSRERTTTESQVIGTGLGMSIVKKLVDLMGGTIKVESELGKGSVFTVNMHFAIMPPPEEFKDKTHEATMKLNENSGTARAMRLLLAEDNDLNAEIGIAVLEEMGMEVERASDGVECIKMLTAAEDGYYDLILMDIQMPNLNGYETTQHIRQLDNKNKAEIPIIAMTANAFDEDRNMAFKVGMNGHVAKPIDVAVLRNEIESVNVHL